MIVANKKKLHSLKAKCIPLAWKISDYSTECTLHRLSPYIGRLKSSIARSLVSHFSTEGDLVIDPFAGSGTIPLEALNLGRKVFAADINPYSEILVKAKLGAPKDQEAALNRLNSLLLESERFTIPDTLKIPGWVRGFFHRTTLKEAIRFANICRERNEYFYLACLLGILHHQRPGFLSYPSSHLVPYLRNKKYPRHIFPELYKYRELRPRIEAKVKRTLKTLPLSSERKYAFVKESIENVKFPEPFDCLITSPPYMNALDYNRDNRLRLWFIQPNMIEVESESTRRKENYIHLIKNFAVKVNEGLKRGGHCIVVVGDQIRRNFKAHPAELTASVMQDCAPSLKLVSVFKDLIPDIRRSRHECNGVKSEIFLVFVRG